MFGIGSSLTLDDFKQFFDHPKAVAMGLVMQMVWLPLISFLIVYPTDLSPELKAGILIMSLCPGGITSNFISYILRLETALSIALTSINSLLILITIPIGTNIILGHYMRIDDSGLSILSTGSLILLLTIVPVGLGVAFNSFYNSTSDGLQKTLRMVNIVLLGIVFAIKFFADTSQGGSGISFENVLDLLPVLLAIHILSVVTSFYLSDLLTKNKLHSLTIGVEVALQNTSLTILITSTLLMNEEMTKPALVASLFTFFSTLALGYYGKRYFLKKA